MSAPIEHRAVLVWCRCEPDEELVNNGLVLIRKHCPKQGMAGIEDGAGRFGRHAISDTSSLQTTRPVSHQEDELVGRTEFRCATNKPRGGH